MILLVFELSPAHLELKEDNLNWWRFGEGVMAAHKVRLGHGYDGSSHEAVHASIGTARINYGVVKVVPGWRKATEVKGGWIGGWEGEQIVRLELHVTRFRRRSSLVLGRSKMAGVWASSRASRRSEEWPESLGSAVHSKVNVGIGERER